MDGGPESAERNSEAMRFFGRRSSDRPDADVVSIDLRHLAGWLRKGAQGIFLLGIIGAVAGFAYATMTTPRYTVTTDILVDPTNLQVVADDLYSQSAQQDSQLLNVDSKVRVLTSGNVLRRVVSELDLVNDPEFVPPPSSGFSIKALLGAKPTPGPPELQALANLAKRVSASREERSFVVTLSVWSENPQTSIAIADALVAAFRDELATAEAEGASRAVDSLSVRLTELRDSVSEAEARVEAFRREHGLQSSGNELLSTREMTELSTLKVAAEASLIEARSRYEALVSASADPAANSAVLASPTIATLRARHAELMQQEGAQALTFGPQHPSRLALQRQIANVEQALADEAARIVGAAKADLDQAEANLASLTLRSDANQSDVAIANEQEVRLRELQRDARAKASVYEAFLARTRQITEREQIDTTNIRVISSPVPPSGRSWPPSTMMVTAAGALSGLALGVILAVMIGLLGDLRRGRKPALAYQ